MKHMHKVTKPAPATLNQWFDNAQSGWKGINELGEWAIWWTGRITNIFGVAFPPAQK